MIDPRVSLAFTLHSNPGAYAVLVGSGASVGAGILTGWQVVLAQASSDPLPDAEFLDSLHRQITSTNQRLKEPFACAVQRR